MTAPWLQRDTTSADHGMTDWDLVRNEVDYLRVADPDCGVCEGDGGWHEGRHGTHDPQVFWVHCMCRYTEGLDDE